MCVQTSEICIDPISEHPCNMACHTVCLCFRQFVVGVSIGQMILECPHNVNGTLDNCWTQVLIAKDDDEGRLGLEAFQDEALHTEEVGTAVLRVSEGIGNMLGEVGSAVADGNGDVPNGGSPA